MKVELHSEQPDQPLRPQLKDLVRDAIHVDLAVAFVTESGADAIHAIINQLNGKAEVRLLASVLFPTDLNAIAILAERIDVHVHLGRTQVDEKLHWQFHSKLGLITRGTESRTVLIGSHNWTRNGLDGGNLEASVIIDCTESDAIVAQTREHIEACRRLSERFNRDRMAVYQAIQYAFHPKASSTETKMSVPGFERSDGVVIFAEALADNLGESGELYFNVPVEVRKQFAIDTSVRVFAFPHHSLFNREHPLPEPRLYSGTIQDTDRRPSESRDVAARSYFIRDIARPCIEAVVSVPPRSGDEMQVVVPFVRDRSSRAVPLFHASGEPNAILMFDVAREDEVYADERKQSLIGLPHKYDAEVGMVPTDLVAETTLKVPFTFAYPPSVKKSLEAHCKSELPFSTPTTCRVVLAEPKSISEFVCSVKYQSDPDLTKTIYSSPNDSLP